MPSPALLPLLSLLLVACPPKGQDSPEETGIPSDAVDPLWDPQVLPTYRLTFASDDWQAQLQAAIDSLEDLNCDDRPYLEADLIFDNPATGEAETWDQVGVRYRGHSSLLTGHDENSWIGLKLSFEEFGQDRVFHGVEKVNLMGSEGDQSLLREHLALQLLRDLDVPAPRSSYALLYANDVYMGIFASTEEPDDQVYLDARFDDPDGHLYKVSGYCGATATLEYWGDLTSEYVETYVPDAGTEEAHLAQDFIPLLACTALASDQEFRTCAEPLMDVEEWLTLVAADMVLPDVDGLPNAGQNFMIYFPPDGPGVVYPWDKDLALVDYNLAHPDDPSIWSEPASWRVDGAGQPTYENIMVQRLFSAYTEEYCARVQAVLDLYDPDVLVPQVEEWRTFLSQWTVDDPKLPYDFWGWMVDDTVSTIQDRYGPLLDQAQACVRE